VRGHRDLEIVARATVLCALLALLLPFDLVRFAFAAPLTLFLPGYAITAATFARKPPAWSSMLVLSVALSLAVLALGGLVLNYMPGGVREITWALLLVLVVLNGCRSAALRRARPPAGAPAWPKLRIDRTTGGLLGGAALMVVATLVLATTSLPANDAVGYTELWISSGADAEAAVARVGVRSVEKRETAYFLRVRLGNEKPVVELFELRPGETMIVRVPGRPRPSPIRLTAALFKQSRPTEIYRRVTGWIPGRAPRDDS
jgi:uncharacterized membrane protein